GLVWNRAMHDEQEQVIFYREENRAQNEICQQKLVSRLSRAACALDFLNENLQPGLRHLDVGCAEGTLLTLTRAKGLKVTGLELDQNWSCFAREVRQLEVLPMTLEDAPLKPASFNLISFVHVVEHLFRPVRTLSIARDLLDDAGYLYVEVPNLDGPLPAPRRFFRRLHNFYFSANTLCAVVSRAGFTPVRLGCSQRDMSVQLLAVKSSNNSSAANDGQDGLSQTWCDDAAQVYQHVNEDRRRYYLMFHLLRQWRQRRRLGQWAFQRYGSLLNGEPGE
ncbi:MAG: class I SAM-dependent methyltransferase, partial [Abitibacteriaceae bacterium]|nr:class I SAM-dependent methyltransferase [Abditibacteriaceae bacterium]